MKRRHILITTLFAMSLINAAVAAPNAGSEAPMGPANDETITQPAPDNVPGGNKFPFPGARDDASTQPTGNLETGSLAIQAVQGTPGGEPIGVTDVTVVIYHNGRVFNTIETQLDEHGVVVIDDLPIKMGIQPVVQVSYADVTYQKVGAKMNPSNPQQALEVTCYELTDDEPAWTMQMRHLMLSPTERGLNVTEVVVINNPEKQTWHGTPGGPKGKRTTTQFQLPADAKEVSLGRGFHDWCCTTRKDRQLINHLPLMPGRTEMTFSYLLASESGTSSVEIAAPAPTGHLMVLMPQGLEATSHEGLVDGGTRPMGEHIVQYYSASNMEPGDTARIALAGLSHQANHTATTNSGTYAKVLAMIGGGLLLVIGLAFVFRRSAKQPVPQT